MENINVISRANTLFSGYETNNRFEKGKVLYQIKELLQNCGMSFSKWMEEHNLNRGTTYTLIREYVTDAKDLNFYKNQCEYYEAAFVKIIDDINEIRKNCKL